ncbi:hypothetical protein RhiirA5_438974 [Rhizophagus irregularis]|uniref:Uncharacterized protein n=1 Tax=Rhizophagus irregularis TaxID=588596 RepID=A0A2N0NIG1_9GLOM|nr:hypothetical protein RhiirA5_438974 [Rhizophagus irregularis]
MPMLNILLNNLSASDRKRIKLGGHPIPVRKGTGISVVGLHHGELVCTVRPHISTKGHGVLLMFPMRPLTYVQSCLRGYYYTLRRLPVQMVTPQYRLESVMARWLS